SPDGLRAASLCAASRRARSGGFARQRRRARRRWPSRAHGLAPGPRLSVVISRANLRRRRASPMLRAVSERQWLLRHTRFGRRVSPRPSGGMGGGSPCSCRACSSPPSSGTPTRAPSRATTTTFPRPVAAARCGSGLGIGVGTLVLLINTSALTLYSFSCHSARHLVGGTLDCFSCSARARVRHSAWRGASALNEHHMAFAWISFVAVCAADLYVRLVAAG